MSGNVGNGQTLTVYDLGDPQDTAQSTGLNLV
jgi:hypothetical protein